MTTSNNNDMAGNTPVPVVASVRDQIAAHLQSQWSFATPIIWENMPPPSPLPKTGWLRFRLWHGRTLARSVSGEGRFRHGSLRLEIAVANGDGAAELDGMVNHLTEVFDNQTIGNVQFTRLTSSPADSSGGYLIVEVVAHFIHPIPLAAT